MSDYRLGAVESRFADMIWSAEPVSSAELARQSAEAFGWKKSTTYTVLRRLCDKGIFRNDRERGLFCNENGTVTSLVSREDFYAMQSEKFIDEAFDGSLPAFLAAFTARKHLSPEEIASLRRMVDEYRED